jgi:hypothetical protein
MAPRTYYAKSQEIVYKPLGTSARPKYKALHARLPVPKKASDVDDSASSQQPAPPVVVPPEAGHDYSEIGPGEGSSFLDYDIPQKKKQVSLSYLLE